MIPLFLTAMLEAVRQLSMAMVGNRVISRSSAMSSMVICWPRMLLESPVACSTLQTAVR